MEFNDLDKGYEAYLRVSNQTDSILANVRYMAYLKFKSGPVRRAIFTNDEDEAKKLAGLAAHPLTQERVNNLLSPHALTLYKATLKRDGKMITNYNLLKNILFVALPVTFAFFYDAAKDRFP